MNKIMFMILIAGVIFISTGCNIDRINATDSTYSKVHVPRDDEILNHPPVIECINCSETSTCPCSKVQIRVKAYDPDGDELTYAYEAKRGEVVPRTQVAYWTLPEQVGSYTMIVKVSDGEKVTMKKIVVRVCNSLPVLRDDH